MSKNIFEGAKFGDKFVTRGNLLAIYVGVSQDTEAHLLLLPFLAEYPSFYGYNEDGSFGNGLETERDIVSRYQETIDEEKLDNLARDWDFHNTETQLVDGYGSELATLESVIRAYKAGYRKAKEE